MISRGMSAATSFGVLSLDKFTWGQWNCLAINSKKGIFTDYAELYEGCPYAFSGLLLFFERAVELIDGDKAFLDQQFAYFLGHSSNPSENIEYTPNID